jgi:hypothetical protein
LIKYVQPVEIATAFGKLAEAFEQMWRDFGMVVWLVLLHSPVPELFFGVWAVLRETLLVGNVLRNLKEAVSAAVPKLMNVPEAVEAILQGQGNKIENPQVRAIIEWASAGRIPGL